MVKKFLASGFTFLATAVSLAALAGFKSPKLGLGLICWYGFLSLLAMTLWIAAEGMKDTNRPFLLGTSIFMHIGNAFVPLALSVMFGEGVVLGSPSGLAKVAVAEVVAVFLPLLLGSAFYNKITNGRFSVSPIRFMFA